MHFNPDLLFKVLVVIDQNIQNLRPAKLRWRPLTFGMHLSKLCTAQDQMIFFPMGGRL